MRAESSRRFGRCALGAALVTMAGIALPAARATNTDGGGNGQTFVPIVPCRLLDTRSVNHVGPRSSPLGAGDTYSQAVTGANGQCTIPAQATGVAMNVTTVNGTADSYLTLWPADATQPLASNLNWQANDGPTPNKVDVKLGADGRVNMFNSSGTVDVIADVVGYYADHNHDDRYYRKAEVDAAVVAAIAQARHFVHHDTYGPFSITYYNGGNGAGIANCISPSTGVPTVPLTVPVGARLISIELDTLDGPGANFFPIQFVKNTSTPTGQTLTVLATQSSGTNTGSTVRVHHVLVPTIPEVIESGESLQLELSVSAGDAFCDAILNYETVD